MQRVHACTYGIRMRDALHTGGDRRAALVGVLHTLEVGPEARKCAPRSTSAYALMNKAQAPLGAQAGGTRLAPQDREIAAL